MGMLLSWLEGPEEIRVERAKKMLNSIESQSRLDFRPGCGLDQSKFRAQFGLEMLHLWALKLNLIAVDRTEGGRHFAEVCEQVWTRAEVRLHEEGIHSFLLSKNLKELQQWTFGSMTAYDKAIITLQDTDNDADFIGALWRNIYDCDPEAKPEHVATLADYTLDQIQILQEADKVKMFEGELHWGTPPVALTRTQEDLDLEKYGEPVLVPGPEKKIIEFRWSSEYPIVR